MSATATVETVDTDQEPVIALTPGALRQVKRQQEKQGKQGWALRLGVRGGGCSGLSYVIDHENEVYSGDGA